MNLHTADISNRLKRFLDRRTPPRRIEGKATAVSDEVAALVATVERNAPRGPEQLAEWWPRFESALGEAGTGLWPTEREIRDAAQATHRAKPVAEEWKIDPYDLNARRMARGDPVGENYLYGREAVEMIGRGLVDETTMRRYRSAAFLIRKYVHGEGPALAWEDEMKARHDDARQIRRERAAS